MEVVEQSERPDRKVYHITARGREELLTWLASDVQSPPDRSQTLIQVFFATQLRDEEVLHIFERAAERLRYLLSLIEWGADEGEAAGLATVDAVPVPLADARARE